MKVVEFFKDQVTVIRLVSVNKRTGYLKIETTELLSKEFLDEFTREFDVTLEYHKKIDNNNNQLYGYLFKPPRLPKDFWTREVKFQLQEAEP